ncbi:PH and SEC7 domain-containing protein 1-like isoform X2 [Ptychodera flava]
MRVGDVIVEVNSHPVENKTTREVVQLLLRSPSTLQLTVIEDPIVRQKVEDFLGGPETVETIQASLSKEDLLSEKIQQKQATHKRHHGENFARHNGPTIEKLDNRPRERYKPASLIRSSSSDSNLSDSPTSRTLTTTVMIHREDSSLKSGSNKAEEVVESPQEDSGVWHKQQEATGSQSSETECSTDQDSQLTDNTVIMVNGVEHFSSSSSTEHVSSKDKPDGQTGDTSKDETDSGVAAVDLSAVEVEFKDETLEGNDDQNFNGNLLEHNGDSGSSESGSLDSLTESEVSLETELMQHYAENSSKLGGATGPVSPGAVQGSLDLPSARRLAKRLYMLDGFKKSDVARHLCKKNDFSQAVAEEYLKFFDFTGDSLDEALRTFLRAFSLTGETQERERILMHFSQRFQENNPHDYASEEAVYTLTCAMMLLNTDLHGQNIGRKMTLPEFYRNLEGLNDGDNFSKDLLKVIYHAIKTNPIEWAVDSDEDDYDHQQSKPAAPIRGNGTIPPAATLGGNPFVEAQIDPNATVYMKGYIMRKSTKEANGKKTPRGKRGWKMYYATLRGLFMYFHKSEIACQHRFETMCDMICIHHSLATRATDYTKKQFVLRLKTADWSEFLMQCGDTAELQEWMQALNVAAATLSAPPLAAPCGSQRRFIRPLLPSTQTRFNKKEQLAQHEDKVQELEADLEDHQSHPPERGAKAFVIQYWKEKLEYLQYEVSRYKTYVYLLESSASPPLDRHVTQVNVQRSNTSVGTHSDIPERSAPVQRSLSDRDGEIRDATAPTQSQPS